MVRSDGGDSRAPSATMYETYEWCRLQTEAVLLRRKEEVEGVQRVWRDVRSRGVRNIVHNGWSEVQCQAVTSCHPGGRIRELRKPRLFSKASLHTHTSRSQYALHRF